MSDFNLLPHCFLVRGAERGAIYDLNTRNVYSVNNDAVSVLNKQKDDDAFWKKLITLGLATDGPSQERFSLPEVVPTLRFMWLEVTQVCNLKCIHCYGSFGSPSVEKCEIDWISTLSQGTLLGCKKVQFIGGEPLLYKNLR